MRTRKDWLQQLKKIRDFIKFIKTHLKEWISRNYQQKSMIRVFQPKICILPWARILWHLNLLLLPRKMPPRSKYKCLAEQKFLWKNSIWRKICIIYRILKEYHQENQIWTPTELRCNPTKILWWLITRSLKDTNHARAL